jgi:hypothetical protein
MPKIILSAVIIIIVTIIAASSAAFARNRTLPAGPEDYIDDNGFWHSLYSDWPNIQRAEASSSRKRRPSHKHGHDSGDR